MSTQKQELKYFSKYLGDRGLFSEGVTTCVHDPQYQNWLNFNYNFLFRLEPLKRLHGRSTIAGTRSGLPTR